MQQKQNPTSLSYRSVYWKLIDGRQTVPRSSCEKCVERAIHNMTFTTTLRQHVFWFPCDVCRWRPERARLQWFGCEVAAVWLTGDGVRLLLARCYELRPRNASQQRTHCTYTFSKSSSPPCGNQRERENMHFSSKFHVSTGRFWTKKQIPILFFSENWIFF